MTDIETGTSTNNPLSKYFRVPGLQVAIPTNGAFLPKSKFTPAPDGTVAVYPMRAADEYLLKNADALLSGYAIEKLLESCVPDIQTPGLISTPDLDVLLLAIRAATYGDDMEVHAACPKCNHENVFNCNLPQVLASMKPLPEENPVRLSNELVAYVRPYNFTNATQIALTTFQETRKIQALEMTPDATEEQKTLQMNASMGRITKLQSEMLADCVYKIITPEGEVNNPIHIREFLAEVHRQWAGNIEKELTHLTDNYGIDKTVKAKCQRKECGHEWETSIEFDPSSFFATGS